MEEVLTCLLFLAIAAYLAHVRLSYKQNQVLESRLKSFHKALSRIDSKLSRQIMTDLDEEAEEDGEGNTSTAAAASSKHQHQFLTLPVFQATLTTALASYQTTLLSSLSAANIPSASSSSSSLMGPPPPPPPPPVMQTDAKPLIITRSKKKAAAESGSMMEPENAPPVSDLLLQELTNKSVKLRKTNLMTPRGTNLIKSTKLKTNSMVTWNDHIGQQLQAKFKEVSENQ